MVLTSCREPALAASINAVTPVFWGERGEETVLSLKKQHREHLSGKYFSITLCFVLWRSIRISYQIQRTLCHSLSSHNASELVPRSSVLPGLLHWGLPLHPAWWDTLECTPGLFHTSTGRRESPVLTHCWRLHGTSVPHAGSGCGAWWGRYSRTAHLKWEEERGTKLSTAQWRQKCLKLILN